MEESKKKAHEQNNSQFLGMDLLFQKVSSNKPLTKSTAENSCNQNQRQQLYFSGESNLLLALAVDSRQLRDNLNSVIQPLNNRKLVNMCSDQPTNYSNFMPYQMVEEKISFEKEKRSQEAKNQKESSKFCQNQAISFYQRHKGSPSAKKGSKIQIKQHKKIKKSIKQKWSTEQYLRYAAFLQIHKEDFGNKKYLLNLCSKFVNGGNLERIKAKHYDYTQTKNNFTVDQIISIVKQEANISDQQIYEMTQQLEFFQEQNIQEIDFSQLVKYSKFASLQQSSLQSELNQVLAQFDYGNLELFLKCLKVNAKIIGFDSIENVNQNKQISQSYERSIVQYEFQLEINNQKFKEIFGQDLLQFTKNKIHKLHLDNRVAEVQITQKIARSNQSVQKIQQKKLQDYLGKQDNKKKIEIPNQTNSNQKLKEKSFTDWNDEENLMFLVFITVYEQCLNKDTSPKVYTMMSNLIKTKSSRACQNHMAYYLKNFKNLEEIQKKILGKICVKDQRFFWQVERLKEICKENTIIMYEKRFRQFTAKSKSKTQFFHSQLLKEKLLIKFEATKKLSKHNTEDQLK